MNITDITHFIKCNYDIEFKGNNVNPDNLSDVTEFLLIDKHNSQGHSALNSLFINTFATPNDAVLAKCIPSMQRVTAENSAQTAWLADHLKI